MYETRTKITKYVTNISKEVCGPNGCPDQNYSNSEGVIHWRFKGDGDGDFAEYASSADEEAIRAYIKHLQEQMVLAQEYLRSFDGEPSGAEFLISIAGMFDPSIKAECDFIKAALRLKVKNWMKERVIDAHHDKADELIRWGEVNPTFLAEECVHDSEIWPKHFHTEILDEETHWVWDLAVDVAKAYEQDKLDLDP